MALYDLSKLLSENTYPGRGIVIGKSADGKSAMIAYFIIQKVKTCILKFQWFLIRKNT